MSSKNYETNGYRHDMDLLVISHLMHVSYSMRSGCREKSIWITHDVYLTANFRVPIFTCSRLEIVPGWEWHFVFLCLPKFTSHWLWEGKAMIFFVGPAPEWLPAQTVLSATVLNYEWKITALSQGWCRQWENEGESDSMHRPLWHETPHPLL